MEFGTSTNGFWLKLLKSVVLGLELSLWFLTYLNPDNEMKYYVLNSNIFKFVRFTLKL